MPQASVTIIEAHFTERDIELIQSNIQELSQAGRLGNADSIAMRLDMAIQRAQDAKQKDNANDIPGDNPEKA